MTAIKLQRQSSVRIPDEPDRTLAQSFEVLSRAGNCFCLGDGGSALAKFASCFFGLVQVVLCERGADMFVAGQELFIGVGQISRHERVGRG